MADEVELVLGRGELRDAEQGLEGEAAEAQRHHVGLPQPQRALHHRLDQAVYTITSHDTQRSVKTRSKHPGTVIGDAQTMNVEIY